MMEVTLSSMAGRNPALIPLLPTSALPNGPELYRLDRLELLLEVNTLEVRKRVGPWLYCAALTCPFVDLFHHLRGRFCCSGRECRFAKKHNYRGGKMSINRTLKIFN